MKDIFKINLIDNYCINLEESVGNVIFNVRKLQIGNSTHVLAVDLDSNKILSNSNEWLSLLKFYYINKISKGVYKHIFKDRNNLLKCYNKNLACTKYREKNVIPFITSFSNGTIHGYAGIFYVICSYLQNYESLKDYNILIYKKSQKGILDIINHFISKGLINRKKVIKIHPDIKYLFNRMKFIPNKWHSYMFSIASSDKLKIDLISEHLFSSKFKFSFSRVAIIKSNINENNTSQGVFSIDDVNNLVNKFELHLIKLSNYNEIKLANVIHQSNLLVLSWGTAFFKNYFYISDKCKKIIVLISNDFACQYYRVKKCLPKKYKNATFYYINLSELEENLHNTQGSITNLSTDLLYEKIESCLRD